MSTPQEIDDFNQNKYQNYCTVQHVSIDKDDDPNDYFSKLVQIRLNYLRKYCHKKKVLDIGCGSGDYLFEIQDLITFGQGIDYTDKAIDAANAKKRIKSISHIEFVKANARHLPFQDNSSDLIFSFSALAHMPQLEDVIKEVARVLTSDGLAILEIGNLSSLNTIVCEAHPELAKTCHVKIPEIYSIISNAKLKVIDRRAFGILPFWANKPTWLRPLLHPQWKHIFQKEINGKMLDEWASNTFLFKPFAYRQFVFLCHQ